MKPSLIEELSAREAEVERFFGSLTPDEFGLRVDSAWTPAEHLEHLNTAVSAVAGGFSVPRWLLRLRFGRARRPSRPYAELQADYRSRLAAGAGASGRFVPPREELAADRSAERQAEILGRWRRVNARLRDALRSWGEADLDAVQLPHPILGKITAREMVFFTIYHDQHHIVAAKSRLPRFAP